MDDVGSANLSGTKDIFKYNKINIKVILNCKKYTSCAWKLRHLLNQDCMLSFWCWVININYLKYLKRYKFPFLNWPLKINNIELSTLLLLFVWLLIVYHLLFILHHQIITYFALFHAPFVDCPFIICTNNASINKMHI